MSAVRGSLQLTTLVVAFAAVVSCVNWACLFALNARSQFGFRVSLLAVEFVGQNEYRRDWGRGFARRRGEWVVLQSRV